MTDKDQSSEGDHVSSEAKSSSAQIARIFVFALIGLYAISAAMQGYLETRLGWLGRIAMFTIAVCLFWPEAYLPGTYLPKLIALVAFLVLLALNLRSASEGREHPVLSGTPGAAEPTRNI